MIGAGETMVDKPTIVSTTYGEGRLVGFSPHPELSHLGNLLSRSSGPQASPDPRVPPCLIARNVGDILRHAGVDEGQR
jgi:hypothetical protein